MNNPITAYWLKHYMADHCTLCGNSGVVDTRGVRTPVGVPCGRLNWCICPNGQVLRHHGPLLPETDEPEDLMPPDTFRGLKP